MKLENMFGVTRNKSLITLLLMLIVMIVIGKTPSKISARSFFYINQRQIEILAYYFTTKGGSMAWVKMDPRMIVEIHKRAAKASTDDFRTATFVPPLAWDRKTALDKILMSFKKEIKDFCYIIHNGKDDLKVSIKRLSDYQNVPYRPINISSLRAISPLKPKTVDKNTENEEENLEDEEGFKKTSSKYRRPIFSEGRNIQEYCCSS